MTPLFTLLEKRTRMGKVQAIIRSKEKPRADQEEKLKSFFKNEKSLDLDLRWSKDESISDGFVLTIGSKTYKWTKASRLEDLARSIENIDTDSSNYLSLLTDKLKEFRPRTKGEEIGRVLSIGDGIAKLTGLESASYGEIVVFETGVKGMVLDLKKDYLGCIIFGEDKDISEGSQVFRTKKTAGIPVGPDLLGRVVNPLGEPIDGQGKISPIAYYKIEKEAPEIIDRQSVYRPLETGILAIDSMFPIGKGQRELIIGDRQTGKTAIALDTILKQKDEDLICIYAAIGQKASSLALLVENLKKKNAFNNCIVVAATAADSAAFQYIAPYSATAIGEYFMDQGKDVLIIYDDLSKHAVAYRSISLLLERSPGREAYPGDVFYLHSRLLERSAQLSEKLGGGSITSLPIVETQAGDISAYIPTNIISITDGQIFLESDLFFAGQRPAINVGLSVSRVGGAAQTKAIKKAAASLRLSLAQYREMEIFTQFASDLDENTKRQLVYGSGLMEILKQNQFSPLKHYEEVIILVIALAKLLIDLDKKKIKKTLKNIISHIESEDPALIEEIERTKDLTDASREKIISLAQAYLDSSK